MDPVTAVGLLASIIQVIDATTTFIQYLNDVKKAPNDRARLAQEATNLLSLLTTMRYKVEEEEEADTWFANIRSLGGLNGPLDQIKAAMEDLARRLQPESGMRKFGQNLMWTIDKKQCNEALTKIERLKTLIMLARQEDSFTLMQAIKAETAELPSRIQGLQSSDNQRKLREWLKPPDPSSNHHAACKKRQPATGSWLLRGRAFADWKTDKRSFLWLRGIPGCGKTVLCSSVIDDITEHCQRVPGSVAAYFYFDFNDSQKQSHEQLVYSLACQLSATSRTAQDLLLSLHASCQNGQQLPNQDTLLGVIRQILQGSQTCYLTLDALDECRSQDDLLALIENIMQWKLDNLHLLATSRPEKCINDSLEPQVTSQICIQSALVTADIQLYIQARLKEDRDLRKWPANVKAEIEATLLEGANGMFRWVVCQLDSLRKCLNLKRIREELKSLPKTLDDTYDRVLARIDEDGYSNEAFTVLQWLCFTARPLGTEEIVEVLAIDLESCQFDPEQRFPEPRDILKVCSSLVSIVTARSWNPLRLIEEEVEEIRLAHFSVKEYLTCRRIQQGTMSSYSVLPLPSHTTIASGCLAYLLHFSGANSLTKDNATTYPLSIYAAEFWTYHAGIAMDHEARSDKLPRLESWIYRLLHTQDCFLASIRLFDPVRTNWTAKLNFDRDSHNLPPLLHYTSASGLLTTTKSLLNAGADVNLIHRPTIYSSTGVTVLQLAVLNGQERIVQLLLDAGANVNAVPSGILYGTALHGAAVDGNVNIVSLLLEAGADVNISVPKSLCGTALIAAAVADNANIVQLLLKAGADVNTCMPESVHGTALKAAVERGCEEVVQQLLDAGADVNSFMPDCFFRTALEGAVARGNETRISLLLKAGADVNIAFPDNHIGTALKAAVEGGQETLLQQLLGMRREVKREAIERVERKIESERVERKIEIERWARKMIESERVERKIEKSKREASEREASERMERKTEKSMRERRLRWRK